MDPIRICFEKTFQVCDVVDISDGDIVTKKPRFDGFMSILADITGEVLFQRPFNYTLHPSPGGKSSCNEFLQRGEVDASLLLSNYPSNHPNIDIRQVTSEGTLVIVSAYNMTEAGRAMSVLDSFKSFSLGTWTLFLLSCFIIASIIITKSSTKRTKRRILNVLGIVVTHIFRQTDSQFKHWFPRSLSVILSCLVLFVSLYYTSLIKTESVVVEKPSLIQSYDDIMAHIDTVTPHFVGTVSSSFKHANLGSQKRFLWEVAKRRDYTIKDNNMIKVLTDLKDGKLCQIIESAIARVSVSALCSFKVAYPQNFKRTFLWVKTDPSSTVIPYGIALRTGVNATYKKVVLRKAPILLENGIYQFAFTQMRPEKMLLDPNYMSEYRTCMSNRLQMPDAGYHALSMKNFEGFYILLIVLFQVTCIVLTIENYLRNRRRNL